MDTIKNFLNPGKATDDEIMYGSGRSPDPVHSGTGNTGTLTGEGTHLAGAKDLGPGPSGVYSTGEGSHFSHTKDQDHATGTTASGSTLDSTATTTTHHSSDLANKAKPRIESDYDRSRTAGNSATGHSSAGVSSMPGGFPDDTESQNPYSSQAVDPRLGATTQNTSSGLGSSTSGTGPTTQSGLANQNTTANTGQHYERDATALGGAAVISDGVDHLHDNERITGPQTTTSTSHPGGKSTTNTSTTTSTTTGAHNSSLLNKLDPRVKTDNSNATNRNQQTDYISPNTTNSTGQHYGRDATALGGAAAVGEGIHHHRENEHGGENLSNPETSTTGASPSYYGAPSGTAVSGPHETATANRLDPKINTSGAPIDDARHHDQQTGGGGKSADLAHGRNDHQHGKDTAGLGASGLGALGAHELSRNHKATELEREHGDIGIPDQTTGTSSTYGKPGSGGTISQYDDNGIGHHHGINAKGAGAAGVGTREAIKHHKENEQLQKEQIQGTTDTTGTPGTYRATGVASGDRLHDEDHHYGKDIAGIGAAGVGAHELSEQQKKREVQKEQIQGTSTTHDASGTIVHSSEPVLTGPVHKSSLLNKLDPRVKEVDSTDVGAIGKQTESSASTTNTSKDHHYGRDAAGVSVAGTGAHELSKQHTEKGFERKQDRGTTDATSSHHHGERDASAAAPLTGAAGYEAEKRHADQHFHSTHTGYAANQPGHDSTNTSSNHHYGRDIAGVGAAGIGAHELSKHQQEKEPEREQIYSSTGTTLAGLQAELGLSEHEKLKREAARNQRGNDYAQNTAGYDSTKTGPAYTPVATGKEATDKNPHSHRNAAVAGGVGAGVYEADKHYGHKREEKALEKEHKREVKEAEREHKHELKEERKEEKRSGGGLLGFLHRDKNKKYSKEENDEFDRQEREHNGHTGRNVALGASVAGIGAHELNKNDKEDELERDQNYGLTGNTTGTTSAKEHSELHPGRDTAGQETVDAGVYEAEKHHGHQHSISDTNKPLPVAPGNQGIGTGEGTQNALVMDRKRGEGYNDHLASGAVGSTLGDKLHGPARNRGIDEATGNISGTNKHADGNFVTGPHSGTGRHVGKDVAVDAGAAGTEGAALEQGSNKHSRGYDATAADYSSSTAGPGYDNTSRQDAGYNSSTAGQAYDNSSGNYGTPTSGYSGLGHGSSTTGGHNKLHKNPPASHPASQGGLTEDGRFIQPVTGRPLEDGGEYPSNVTGTTGTHVPADGGQRQDLIGQGVQGDSGVANPHGNSSGNY